nr:uncharacterized protein LOC107446588 [Parasteatoda tepidariorum]
MVQAFDPDTGDTIGKFMEGNGLHDIEKCSSMTHSDPSDKKSATLIWIAPDDKSGKVNFRTTVVKEFNMFWVRMLAKVEPLPFSADQTSVDKVDSS